jgi:TRAP-type C4-dicarboxylate transport system permease small subunit
LPRKRESREPVVKLWVRAFAGTSRKQFAVAAESSMSRFLLNVPKLAITALIIFAIINLLVGVVLRYFVGAITDWLDVDPVPFTWVEEVGELSLAWLTLIGAAIGIRSRSHFTLAVFVHRLPRRAQLWIHRFNHALIAGVGLLVAWYGFKLCLLNNTLTTPGLQINLAWLYASAVVGGVLIAVYGLLMMISPLPQGEPQH